MFNLKTRICKCCKNKDKISIWEIWKKLHITNTYTKTVNKNSLWRISSKFKLYSRLCFFCYCIVYVWLYFEYLLHMTIDTDGKLLYIFLNLFILLFPFILTEFILLFTVSIECEKQEP